MTAVDAGTDRRALTGLVKGRVQGVFFRAETRRMARGLGLGGWVRNTPDGHVEVLFGGPAAAVEAMREWLREGPELARVDAVELTGCGCPPGRDFRIL